MEQPQLQDIRDACADFFRGNGPNDETAYGHEDEDKDEDENDDDSSASENDKNDLYIRGRAKNGIPDKWEPKRRKTKRRKRVVKPSFAVDLDGPEAAPGEKIDFGRIDKEDSSSKKNVIVKICGRLLYFYPSERSMSRGGWLHFSILAKDCS